MLQILIDAVKALNVHQEMGYIHGDIKTTNIMIIQDPEDHQWTAKIIDFGLTLLRSMMPLSPDPFYKIEEYHENVIKYPSIAPEVLSRKTGDTYASETYAVGYILQQIGLSYSIDAVQRLGNNCMDEDPDKRPSLNEIVGKLKRIRFSLGRQRSLARRRKAMKGKNNVQEVRLLLKFV